MAAMIYADINTGRPPLFPSLFFSLSFYLWTTKTLATVGWITKKGGESVGRAKMQYHPVMTAPVF